MPAGSWRALVLAAGLGTRLRPLTESTPKPLLPVVGLPILGHTLAQLAAAGCTGAAVNLHHCGEQIRQRFGASFAGMPLTWSDEPVLLGTLGALHPLREFFAAAELVVLINGDSLCRWPLRRLLRAHQAAAKGPAAATLLLTRRADPAQFGGGVGIDGAGDVVSFRPGGPERAPAAPAARRLVFAGAHVFGSALLKRVDPGVSDIVRDLYTPLLGQGERIGTVVSGRRWHDLGTPRRFLDATLAEARAGWPERLWRRAWVSREAVVGSGVRLREAVLEAGARVGDGVRLERAVLLPGAQVGGRSTLREVIVGPGAVVPPGSWVERRLVTAWNDGRPRDLDESVVGGAVYTPLDGA
jgi:mannose-1-phosphate guanylyltransferase